MMTRRVAAGGRSSSCHATASRCRAVPQLATPLLAHTRTHRACARRGVRVRGQHTDRSAPQRAPAAAAASREQQQALATAASFPGGNDGDGDGYCRPYVSRARELRSDGSELVRQLTPVARVRTLFLPEGYPQSVSSDYLAYQLWTVPTHITGWLSHSLTTSSLLQAVGINAGPVGTAGLTAAFKWIAKDGVGALGRLFVGGRLGLELDDDPRRWRMIAELVTTLGLLLEALTSVYPSQFLLLACSGTFAKAVGKGVGKPCFRVVQTHFAIENNVGAVSAKEEVWEVVGQLSGYAGSLLVLQWLESTGSSSYVISAWALSQAAHVVLRRVSLSALVFPTLSRKRACMLAAAHVSGGPLPGVQELNKAEPLWESPGQVRPRMVLGCSLDDVLGEWQLDRAAANGAGGVTAAAARVAGGAQPGDGVSASGGGEAGWVDVSPGAARYAELYRNEQYLLAWDGTRARVVLKTGAHAATALRATWQAAWLDRHHSQPDGCTGSAGVQLGVLRASLDALQQRYGRFEAEARSLGWELDRVNLKCGRVRVCLE